MKLITKRTTPVAPHLRYWPAIALGVACILLSSPKVRSNTVSKTSSGTVGTAKGEKTVLVTGLKEPQGLALDKDGSILIAEYKGGRISRYSRDGKPLGALSTSLKSPAMMVPWRGAYVVADRQSNRVVRVKRNGETLPLGGEIAEPLGLAVAPDDTLFAVSHTTSKVLRFDGKAWHPIFEAPPAPDGEKRYGYRCLAYGGGMLLMSDEVSGGVFLLSQGGRIASWTKDIGNPSGVVIGPDGLTYVTNEDSGGQLLRVAADGTSTVVAEGLGRPRGVLFLDAKQALVSDRGGTLWRVDLP